MTEIPTEPESEEPLPEDEPEDEYPNPYGDDTPAPVQVEPPVQQAAKVSHIGVGHRRPGRRPGSKNKPKEPDAHALGQLPAPDPSVPEGMDPGDVLVLWPQILKKYRDLGHGPQNLFIKVYRLGGGLHPTPPTHVDTIDGLVAVGDGTKDPGISLVDYVTRVIHVGRKLPGPATYHLFVWNKLGVGSNRRMMVVCDDPEEILAQDRRREAYMRGQPASVGVGALPPVSVPVYAQPQAPAALPPPPQPQPGQLATDFFQQLQMYEQFRSSIAPAAAPYVPPPPAAPSVPPELVKEFADVRAELAALKAQKEAEQIARNMLADPNVALGLGYVRASAAPQAPAPAQAVQAAATTPIGALKQLLTDIKELETVKGQFGKILGLQEKPEEPEEPEKPEELALTRIPLARFGAKRDVFLPSFKESEGFVDYLTKFAASNAEMSMDMGMTALERGMRILDQTQFGKVLANLAQQGGAAAQLASEAQAKGLVGVGAVNGKPQGPLG